MSQPYAIGSHNAQQLKHYFRVYVYNALQYYKLEQSNWALKASMTELSAPI